MLHQFIQPPKINLVSKADIEQGNGADEWTEYVIETAK